jgi:hypothetical protein
MGRLLVRVFHATLETIVRAVRLLKADGDTNALLSSSMPCLMLVQGHPLAKGFHLVVA